MYDKSPEERRRMRLIDYSCIWIGSILLVVGLTLAGFAFLASGSWAFPTGGPRRILHIGVLAVCIGGMAALHGINGRLKWGGTWYDETSKPDSRESDDDASPPAR